MATQVTNEVTQVTDRVTNEVTQVTNEVASEVTSEVPQLTNEVTNEVIQLINRLSKVVSVAFIEEADSEIKAIKMKFGSCSFDEYLSSNSLEDIVLENNMQIFDELFKQNKFKFIDKIIFILVKQNNLEVFEYFINRIDIQQKFISFVITNCNNIKFIELLKMKGIRMDIIDEKTGKSLLHFAAENGNRQFFEYFINEGLDIKFRDFHSNNTFYYACIGNSKSIIKWIIKNYPDIIINYKIRNTYLMSPLQLLYKKNYIDIIYKLIEIGFKLIDEESILEDACKNNDFDFVKYLIDNGADIKKLHQSNLQYGSGNLKIIEYLENKGYIINRNNMFNFAVQVMNTDIINYLVYDKDRNFCIDTFCSLCSSSRILNDSLNTSTLKYLIKLIDGHDIILFIKTNNIFERALMDCNSHLLKLLIELGFIIDNDIAEKNIDQILFDYNFDYRRSYNKKIIDVLLKYINISESYLLHKACYYNKLHIVKILLSNGFDININKYDIKYKNMTPLHYACNESNFEMVSLLLNYGADINIKSLELDESAIIIAFKSHRWVSIPSYAIIDLKLAEYKCIDIIKIIKLLINNGANIVDPTPLSLICEYGDKKIDNVKYIKEITLLLLTSGSTKPVEYYFGKYIFTTWEATMLLVIFQELQVDSRMDIISTLIDFREYNEGKIEYTHID